MGLLRLFWRALSNQIRVRLYTYEWSPSALVLAYATQDSINIWNLQDGSRISLPQYFLNKKVEVFWAPGGAHLAVVSADPADPWQKHHGSISIMSPAGLIVWDGLTSFPSNVASSPDEWESPWSADGRTCLVYGHSSGHEYYTVVLVDQDPVYLIEAHGIAGGHCRGSLSPCGGVLMGLVSHGRAAVGDMTLCAISSTAVSVGYMRPWSLHSVPPAMQPAWHPSPRLSFIFAFADADGNVSLLNWQEWPGAEHVGLARSGVQPDQVWKSSAEPLWIAGGLVSTRTFAVCGCTYLPDCHCIWQRHQR